MSSSLTFIAEYLTEERFNLLRTRRWLRQRRELAGFLIDVLCVLVAERATGRLTINLSEGSASSAEFEQREHPTYDSD